MTKTGTRAAAAIGVCLSVAASPALAESSKSPPAADQPKPCDVYGPGFKPVGNTGVCVRIGGSVTVDVRAAGRGGDTGITRSSDWIKDKAARNRN